MHVAASTLSFLVQCRCFLVAVCVSILLRLPVTVLLFFPPTRCDGGDKTGSPKKPQTISVSWKNWIWLTLHESHATLVWESIWKIHSAHWERNCSSVNKGSVLVINGRPQSVTSPKLTARTPLVLLVNILHTLWYSLWLCSESPSISPWLRLMKILTEILDFNVCFERGLMAVNVFGFSFILSSVHLNVLITGNCHSVSIAVRYSRAQQ